MPALLSSAPSTKMHIRPRIKCTSARIRGQKNKRGNRHQSTSHSKFPRLRFFHSLQAFSPKKKKLSTLSEFQAFYINKKKKISRNVNYTFWKHKSSQPTWLSKKARVFRNCKTKTFMMVKNIKQRPLLPSPPQGPPPLDSHARPCTASKTNSSSQITTKQAPQIAVWIQN